MSKKQNTVVRIFLTALAAVGLTALFENQVLPYDKVNKDKEI